MPGRSLTAGWSPWWPPTSRPRKTIAGATSATTQSYGESSCVPAGCGCLIWPLASFVRWTASAGATSSSWRRGRGGRAGGPVGGADWSDIVSGIDLLVAEGVADPDRLGIGGASYGGFMAAWAIGQTDRFKAAIMDAGISDWGALLATGEFGTTDAALSGS